MSERLLLEIILTLEDGSHGFGQLVDLLAQLLVHDDKSLGRFLFILVLFGLGLPADSEVVGVLDFFIDHLEVVLVLLDGLEVFNYSKNN